MILHAGMPKTGSSSVQNWMRDEVESLREGGVTVLSDLNRENPGVFSPFVSGLNVASNHFLLHYSAEIRGEAEIGRRQVLVDEFVDGVSSAAAECGDVIVTAEGLASALATGDEVFLGGLERLTADHELEIAYYVRPQDSAIEARWRAWGYKSRMLPSEWVRADLVHLDYWATVENVRRLAPSVVLNVRPFHPDLLDGGDAVADFAARVLRIDGLALPQQSRRDNVGVPLDFVNMLRDAPESLWTTPQKRGVEVGLRQVQIGRLGRELGIAESPEVEQSRVLLTEFAAHTFGKGNAHLEADFGWPPGFLAADDATAEVDLQELDELWTVPMSATAQHYLFAALERLLQGDG